jgi:hypothetical protein
MKKVRENNHVLDFRRRVQGILLHHKWDFIVNSAKGIHVSTESDDVQWSLTKK